LANFGKISSQDGQKVEKERCLSSPKSPVTLSGDASVSTPVPPFQRGPFVKRDKGLKKILVDLPLLIKSGKGMKIGVRVRKPIKQKQRIRV